MTLRPRPSPSGVILEEGCESQPRGANTPGCGGRAGGSVRRGGLSARRKPGLSRAEGREVYYTRKMFPKGKIHLLTPPKPVTSERPPATRLYPPQSSRRPSAFSHPAFFLPPLKAKKTPNPELSALSQRARITSKQQTQ